MDKLPHDRASLLRDIVEDSAIYMVEDARNWGEDAAEVRDRARWAEELAADGLIRAVGQHMNEEGPGVFTLYQATSTGIVRVDRDTR